MDEEQCLERRASVFSCYSIIFLHHYIRKIIHLLQKHELFARKMEDRKEDHDHFSARFLAGQTFEMHIPFFLNPAEHFGDLFLKRDDLFPDRLRFELVRFIVSKIPPSAAVSASVFKLVPG